MRWFENDGSQSFTTRVVSASATTARDVEGIDLDLDGDIDLVAVSNGLNTVDFYENDNSESFTRRILDSAGASPQCAFPIDVDSRLPESENSETLELRP